MRHPLQACIARHRSARPYAGAHDPCPRGRINVPLVPPGVYVPCVPSCGPRGIRIDELRGAIAVLFKRKGKEELSEKEFVLSASMDLRWFPPKDAQRFLQLGIETGLLESRKGAIRPTFEVTSIEVPRDFAPTASVFETPTPVAEDLFVAIVDAIAARTGSERRAVIANVNAIQDRLDVDVEVAALVAARTAGIDVSPFVTRVRARLGMP